MCKPTDRPENNNPKPRGLKREAEDEIDCEIVTSPDLLQDIDADTNQSSAGEDEANLTEEQRQELGERRVRSRLSAARARQRQRDQLASLQATVEHQSTRVIQLEQTNNTLIEQIQKLNESKNRLLEMVEVAKNGLHQDLPRALTGSIPIPHRVALPPPPPAMNLDAIFLLNHIQGASTLSPVIFDDTYLLAILGALSSERNNTSQQAPPEQTSGYSQRHHQPANTTAAAYDLLGSTGPKI
jgi:hypothetical protein